MDVEFGNAGTADTRGNGWFVGYSDWLPGLRHVPRDADVRGLCVKWMHHRAGDPGGEGKPLSEGRTVSILVGESGAFRIHFGEAEAELEVTLRRHGDFVAWGAGLQHRWAADADSTILTLRWMPAH